MAQSDIDALGVAKSAGDLLANQESLVRAALGRASLPTDWLRADQYPTLVLDFVRGASLAEKPIASRYQSHGIQDKAGFDLVLTFTRSTTGTYIDANGILQTAAIDEPRFDHDPVTGECRGLMVEGTRTNLFTESEFRNGLSDAPNRDGLITAVAATGWPGALPQTGLAFGHDGATNTYAYKSYNLSDSTEYVISVIVEMDDSSAPAFGSSTSADSSNDFSVIAEGGNLDPLKYTVTPMGGNVYRVSCKKTSGVSNNSSIGIVKYAGNSPRTFTVSGYQVEQGGTMTSYIPTTTAQVTRTADVCRVDNISPWFDAAEGAIFMEYSTKSGYGATFSDGTSTNRLILRRSGAAQEFVSMKDGATLAGAPSNGAAGDAMTKVAASWDGATLLVSQDGTTAASRSAGHSAAISQLNVGSNAGNDFNLNGHIKELRYYPHALTANELEALTA